MTETDTVPPPETESEAPAEAAAPAAPMPAAPDAPVWTVGRRKKSTARVCLSGGTGKFQVNGRTLDTYFSAARERETAVLALEKLGSRQRFDVRVNVHGGGPVGQSGAIALGVARALVRCDAGVVPQLRAAGLLTRDARVKERKKYGRRGARRGFQFSKR